MGISILIYIEMKEDLHLTRNDINYIGIAFCTAYCVSMIPACYYLTRSRINIVLPTLEVGWGLFTFGCAWARNLSAIYVMRVFIGICESCSFTGVIYVIGSWYKPKEIGRRVSLFILPRRWERCLPGIYRQLLIPIWRMCMDWRDGGMFFLLGTAYVGG